MRIDYSDGSFMLSWDKIQAWYSKDGKLKDAEYKRRYRGFPSAVAVSSKHTKVIEWLEEQGKRKADLLNRGIITRKIAQ